MAPVFTLSTSISKTLPHCLSECRALEPSGCDNVVALKDHPLPHHGRDKLNPSFITTTCSGHHGCTPGLPVVFSPVASLAGVCLTCPLCTQKPQQSFFKPQNILYIDSPSFPSLHLFLKEILFHNYTGKISRTDDRQKVNMKTNTIGTKQGC